MQTVLVVCIILITIAILIGTVQFILTMIQVRQTAKETENIAKKINAASQILDLMFLGGSLFSLITSKIINTLSKKKEEDK